MEPRQTTSRQMHNPIGLYILECGDVETHPQMLHHLKLPGNPAFKTSSIDVVFYNGVNQLNSYNQK